MPQTKVNSLQVRDPSAKGETVRVSEPRRIPPCHPTRKETFLRLIKALTINEKMVSVTMVKKKKKVSSSLQQTPYRAQRPPTGGDTAGKGWCPVSTKHSYRSGRKAANSREETGRRSEDSSRHLVREEMQLTNTRTRTDHTHKRTQLT